MPEREVNAKSTNGVSDFLGSRSSPPVMERLYRFAQHDSVARLQRVVWSFSVCRGTNVPMDVNKQF